MGKLKTVKTFVMSDVGRTVSFGLKGRVVRVKVTMGIEAPRGRMFIFTPLHFDSILWWNDKVEAVKNFMEFQRSYG